MYQAETRKIIVLGAAMGFVLLSMIAGFVMVIDKILPPM